MRKELIGCDVCDPDLSAMRRRILQTRFSDDETLMVQARADKKLTGPIEDPVSIESGSPLR